MSTATQTKITEAGGADAIRQHPVEGSRREITIIREGWGSSGYYPKEVLERDGPRVFPVGTHLYIDHPTPTEERERPERSVRDLAATIVEAPRMAGIDLVAVAEIKPHWEPVINALAEDIGLSIRASGVIEQGEAGGREGSIVKALTEGYSVDFVTKAGAGGKIGKLIESARSETKIEEARNAANWFEARIHRDFTNTADHMFGEGYLTREERVGLSSGIGEALTAFNAYVDENIPGLKDRDPFAEAPGAETAVQENSRSGGVTMEDNSMSDEKRLSELEESVRQLTKDQEETKSQLDEANRKAKEAETRAERAEDALKLREAGSVVGEALQGIKGLPEKALQRVVESTLAQGIPTSEDGKLDKAVLTERAKAKAKEEQEYLSSAGVKFGESAVTTTTTASDDEGGAALEEAFRKLNLSEAAAKAAARGR